MNHVKKFRSKLAASFSVIDDHAKDGGTGKSDYCVVFTMTLGAIELKQTLIRSVFQVIQL